VEREKEERKESCVIFGLGVGGQRGLKVGGGVGTSEERVEKKEWGRRIGVRCGPNGNGG
jgi:hypothetical protein